MCKAKIECEYINDEKNGKGKENYENGNLKFCGEYLNGKKWNGKGYDKNGNISFEIKEGNGYIIEYDFSGKLKFEGNIYKG